MAGKGKVPRDTVGRFKSKELVYAEAKISDLESRLSYVCARKEEYAKDLRVESWRLREANRRIIETQVKLERAKQEKAKPRLPVAMQEAVAGLPVWLREVAREVTTDPSLRSVVREVMTRKDEFATETIALLAGIGMDDAARIHVDKVMDAYWKRGPEALVPALGIELNTIPVKELIVGGGLHAAIYCSVRARMGKPKPVVLERGKVGGVFACSERPSFYLNSRNRPGRLSYPGDLNGSLNVLPGAPLQPADLLGCEYQRNTDIAWAIRVALALTAEVVKVPSISVVGSGNVLSFSSGTRLQAGRVILSPGLNEPNTWKSLKSSRVVRFEDLMAKMDKPFPLRGMERVAVIGAGDSGKTAIESLTGQGPPAMAISSLDRLERIVWYGVSSDRVLRKSWETCNRSRYKGIGRLFSDGFTRGIVTPLAQKAERFYEGYDCVYVNDEPYDMVVDCTGFLSGTAISASVTSESNELRGETVPSGSFGNQFVARQRGTQFMIGPSAKLSPSSGEMVQLNNIGENATSIFYYAKKTAALAASLA